MRRTTLSYLIAVTAAAGLLAGQAPALAGRDGPGTSPPTGAHPAGPTALAFPDFNGDGYADLAVGDIFEDVVKQNGRQAVDAGGVEVMYGSPTGIQADGTGAPDDQYWTQANPDVQEIADPGDHFGFVTAPSDFNNDGFDDLAIGIELESVGLVNFAGAVEVLYGSAAGLQATGVGGPDDQFWSQDSPGVEDQAEEHDGFGRALATADFNGDGYADLAIGDRGEATDTVNLAGAVNVLYGSATGLQADGIGGPDDQFWTQDSAGVKDQAENSDFFGRSMGAGDFNSDGFADLVIGAYAEDIASVQDAGAFNVLFGSATGLQSDGIGGPDDQFWFQGVNGLQDQAEGFDVFGRSFAVGDYNADGFPDLAVGARREDIETVPEAGAVSVLYGSPVGLQADGVSGPDDQFWYQGANGVRDRPEATDWLGNALAAADFNFDGYADLAIGARREDIGDVKDSGSVNVLYGSSVGLQADGVAGPDDQFWFQGTNGLQDTPEADDVFGFSLAAGDFNADSFPDLAIGAVGEALEAELVNDAGVVQVLYSTAGGVQADSPDDQFWTQNSPGVEDDAENDDLFGWSLGASTP